MQQQANKWMNTIKSHSSIAFKRIRIRNRGIKPSKADCLISKRNKLAKQGNNDEAAVLDAQIATIITEENRSKALMFKKIHKQCWVTTFV